MKANNRKYKSVLGHLAAFNNHRLKQNKTYKNEQEYFKAYLLWSQQRGQYSAIKNAQLYTVFLLDKIKDKWI